MEWSIHEISMLVGTTSRTLRHYDGIGLLQPSRTGHNGYRYYDQAALVRLQRILLLRQLGLGLPQITGVLSAETSETRALTAHLVWLHREQEHLTRQIASVTTTIDALKGGEQLMAQEMFDGFDHTQHQAEVTDRWGADAYARGDSWWRSMTPDDRAVWKAQTVQLQREWIDAAASGSTPDSAAATALARRHVAWLTAMPGTPASEPGGDAKGYVTGLGEMYVADDRFAANYGGADGARFVRDALQAYAESYL